MVSSIESLVNAIPNDSWNSILIGITVARYIFIQYLDYRQYRFYQREQPPIAVKGVVDNDTYAKSQAYGRANTKLKAVEATTKAVFDIAIVHFNYYPSLWNLAGAVSGAMGFSYTSTAKSVENAGASLGGVILQSIWFYLINLAITTVFMMPFEAYRYLVVEEKFGFNKQTGSGFIMFQLTNFSVSAIIHVGLIYGMLEILDYSGDLFLSYVIVAIIGFVVFIQTIYGSLIVPIFYKRTPLEKGELYDQIKALADTIGFPMSALYVLNGSSVTTHGNAFFCGMPWKVQINIFDNLLDQLEVSEVVAISAHEMGHWKRWHTVKATIFTLSLIWFRLKVFQAFIFNAGFYSGLGFLGTKPVVAGAYLFSYIAQADVLTKFLESSMARSGEYEADQFAKEVGYRDLVCSGLIKAKTHNLDEVEADWLYSMYHRDHPLLIERLDALGYKPGKSD
ncbi:CAAX prenyl protease 1 [Diutina catenulata]